MGGSSKKVTVGYRYRMGLHLIFSHGPIDKVTKIEMDGKTAWSGLSTGGGITINAPNLFGGEEKEGGVSGTVDLEMGVVTQPRNSYLQSKLGVSIPAFRGVVGMVLRQMYIGMSPYLRRWDVWGSRIHVRQDGIAQWYDAKADVLGDMNPAHIIRECVTDPDWGMGYPESDVDDVTFSAAADQMFIEGMGISLLWDKVIQLDDFIGQILKHIDGSLYVHRTTGKFVLKLARSGYSVPSLLVLSEDNVSKITDFKRGTMGELTNSVTVVYWDYNTGKNGSITVQDIALVAQQGATNGTTMQYPGFTRGALASQIASRDLKVMSTPLASCTVYANRVAADLNIGDLFVLNWPRYGVVQIVMRVLSVELGNLESNQVKIVAVEDAFGLDSAIYAPPPPSEWIDPVSDPAPCPYHLTTEATYWELVQRMGETEARALDPTSGFAFIAGVRPSGDATNARIMTNPGGSGYKEAGSLDFCPTALLNATLTPNQTNIAIAGVVDSPAIETATYIQIGAEMMSLVTYSDTLLVVGRGVLDTVPTTHVPGERVWFLDNFGETDEIEYAASETARLKLLTTTSKGTLLIGSAVEQTVVIAARPAKPYPPGLLRINGLAYPNEIKGTSTLTLTYAHRDRLQQTVVLVPTETGSIGPEAGTTYSGRLLRADTLAVLDSVTGISVTTFNLTSVYSGSVILEVWSVRGGVESWQRHRHTFEFQAGEPILLEDGDFLTTESSENITTEN